MCALSPRALPPCEMASKKVLKLAMKQVKAKAAAADKEADPQWWHVDKRDQDVTGNNMVTMFQGDTGKDAPDGELDYRTTSRAQREVWKKKMHLASAEDQERFLFLAYSGRHQPFPWQANESINAYVPRDAGWSAELKPRSMTIRKIGQSSTRSCYHMQGR